MARTSFDAEWSGRRPFVQPPMIKIRSLNAAVIGKSECFQAAVPVTFSQLAPVLLDQTSRGGASNDSNQPPSSQSFPSNATSPCESRACQPGSLVTSSHGACAVLRPGSGRLSARVSARAADAAGTTPLRLRGFDAPQPAWSPSSPAAMQRSRRPSAAIRAPCRAGDGCVTQRPRAAWLGRSLASEARCRPRVETKAGGRFCTAAPRAPRAATAAARRLRELPLDRSQYERESDPAPCSLHRHRLRLRSCRSRFYGSLIHGILGMAILKTYFLENLATGGCYDGKTVGHGGRSEFRRNIPHGGRSEFRRNIPQWRGCSSTLQVGPRASLQCLTRPAAKSLAQGGVASACVVFRGYTIHVSGPSDHGLQGYRVSSLCCPRCVAVTGAQKRSI